MDSTNEQGSINYALEKNDWQLMDSLLKEGQHQERQEWNESVIDPSGVGDTVYHYLSRRENLQMLLVVLENIGLKSREMPKNSLGETPQDCTERCSNVALAWVYWKMGYSFKKMREVLYMISLK